VSRQRDLAPELFAEGLAIVGDRVFQLTWREGIALMHAAGDLSPLGAVSYEGEGWGLCYDGARLVMSDGSDRLTFRDPVTFDVVGGVDVTAAGQPVERLNELECAESLVYANVWQTDRIVAIDPETGAVTAIIDASGLLSPEERAGADVLNGIAWRPETGTFLVTGKLWPKLFEVEWVDLGASPTGSAP
jgi:glutaminyl-peptide cyclotransferase